MSFLCYKAETVSSKEIFWGTRKHPLSHVPRELLNWAYQASEELNPIFDPDVVIVVDIIQDISGVYRLVQTDYIADYTPETWLKRKFPHPDEILRDPNVGLEYHGYQLAIPGSEPGVWQK